METKTYMYVGPVFVWGRLYTEKVTLYTEARGQEEALRNFKHQFRTMGNLVKTIPLDMPGTIRVVKFFSKTNKKNNQDEGQTQMDLYGLVTGRKVGKR